MSRGFNWNPLESSEVAKHADAIASELLGSLYRARDHLLDPARHPLPGKKTALEHRLAAKFREDEAAPPTATGAVQARPHADEASTEQGASRRHGGARADHGR